MGRIPDEIIQQVRDRVDLVDLVGRFVSLKQAGRNHKGLCPFHGEKTPSFVVTPDRGTYKCFGCGEGGNAYGFLMQMDDAVRGFRWENLDPYIRSHGGTRLSLWGSFAAGCLWLVILIATLAEQGPFHFPLFAAIAVPYAVFWIRTSV